ncbi:MAG TPA: AraC family transcriptional regulator [Chitinophagaceae bacterium]|nr:AraC family transcriptional regulator [Chitinophagaceae bacterium]
MQSLEKGKFYGHSKKELSVNGLTIVDSSFYHYIHCPWHYHQNAHFAFTTSGTLVETHKHEKIQLSPGSLLYNHSQEPHCNSDYSENVSALHVDMHESWFAGFGLDFLKIQGVHKIRNPLLKNIFFNLFKELKNFDSVSLLTIESLVVQGVSELLRQTFLQNVKKPPWVSKVKDLLYDRFADEILLREIAAAVNIHPVYLSQQFPVFFHNSFGEYIRKIRIEKAVEFILGKASCSLTEIGFLCGFADQSHFIRTFKKNIGVTPLAFKRAVCA